MLVGSLNHAELDPAAAKWAEMKVGEYYARIRGEYQHRLRQHERGRHKPRARIELVREELRAIQNNLRALESVDTPTPRTGYMQICDLLRDERAEDATFHVTPAIRARAAQAARFAARRCGIEAPDVVFYRPTARQGERFYGFMFDTIRDNVFVSTITIGMADQVERTTFHEVRHLAQSTSTPTAARELDAAAFAEQTLSEWRKHRGHTY